MGGRPTRHLEGMTLLAFIYANCRVTPSGCWEWLRSRRKHGYGQMQYRGKNHSVQHLAYDAVRDDRGDGHLRHKCDWPPCCNPEHGLPGTHQDNMDDMRDRKRYCVPGLKRAAHPRAKLSEQRIASIRADTRPHRAIAQDHGVSQVHVSRIKRNAAWVE